MNSQCQEPIATKEMKQISSMSEIDAFEFDSNELPEEEGLNLDFDSSWAIESGHSQEWNSHVPLSDSIIHPPETTGTAGVDDGSIFSEMDLKDTSCEDIDNDDALLEWDDVLMQLSYDDEHTENTMRGRISNLDSNTNVVPLNIPMDIEPDLSVYQDMQQVGPKFQTITPPTGTEILPTKPQIPRKVSDATLVKNSFNAKNPKEGINKPKFTPSLVPSVVPALGYVKPISNVPQSQKKMKSTRPEHRVSPIQSLSVITTSASASKQNATIQTRKPLPPPPLSTNPKVPLLSNSNLVNMKTSNSTKEARRKRIEHMLTRQRGLYQRRQRERERKDQENSEMSSKSVVSTAFNAMDEATTSAAVAAALSVTSTTIPDTDVAKIAFNLIHSVTQVKKISAREGVKMTSPPKLSKSPQSKVIPTPPQPVKPMIPTVLKSSVPPAPLVSKSTKNNLFKPKELKSSTTATKKASTSSKMIQGNSATAKKAKTKSSASNTSKIKSTTAKTEVEKKESIHGVDLPTGSDPESRRQRRLIRNRLSAQLHRERKREAMDSLQKKIEDRDEIIDGLKKELRIAHVKSTELESSLAILRNHFGTDLINGILSSSLPNKRSPELVSTSGSECSDSDETITPPSSPEHESPESSNSSRTDMGTIEVKKRKRILSDNTEYSNGTVSNSKSTQKRKKSTKGAAFVVSMATCALLGCIALLNPTSIDQRKVNTRESKNDSPKIGPTSFIAPSSARESDFFSSHHHEAGRRLLSVPTADLSEEDNFIFDGENRVIDCSECNSDRTDWVISPLEMNPAQWEVNHELPFSSPWTVQSSHPLFDLQSLTYTGATTTQDIFPVSSTALFSSSKKEEREEYLAGADNRRKLRGSKLSDDTLTFTDEETTTEIISPISFSQSSQSVGGFSKNGDVLNIGSSFVFCPNAHASLSPGFVDLLNVNNKPSKEAKIKRTVNEIRSSKNSLFSSKRMQSLLKSKVSSRFPQGKENKFNSKRQPNSLIEDKEYHNYNEENSETERALVLSDRAKYANSFNMFDEDMKFGQSVFNENDPFMTFLVPASVLEVNELDLFENIDDSSDSTQWVELGCQIRTARVVSGVDFVGSIKDPN